MSATVIMLGDDFLKIYESIVEVLIESAGRRFKENAASPNAQARTML
jgi:hypothetical protein